MVKIAASNHVCQSKVYRNLPIKCGKWQKTEKVVAAFFFFPRRCLGVDMYAGNEINKKPRHRKEFVIKAARMRTRKKKRRKKDKRDARKT